MDDSAKKALRAKAKKMMREQAEAEWDEKMVLEPPQLKALLDHLDERLTRADCDHTLRVTEAWAVDNGVDPAKLAESVLEFGGGCDCEVLANVDPETSVDRWPRYEREVLSG